jgi:hypothetical protein
MPAPDEIKKVNPVLLEVIFSTLIAFAPPPFKLVAIATGAPVHNSM